MSISSTFAKDMVTTAWSLDVQNSSNSQPAQSLESWSVAQTTRLTKGTSSSVPTVHIVPSGRTCTRSSRTRKCYPAQTPSLSSLTKILWLVSRTSSTQKSIPH
ncbi:hypothetical protein K457DRAFT_175121 [Linnemannia elongata AG-77]|uniref:Uncharacterized protein n=1 Tax=Linnemannia elongata AG-77 TaxID=1314771 RepID=A0A197KHM7_9FUNG|nr:hypothetical protein K457DRAFT_175121 [Linnemannia elongata AG-77]